jgi:hypothetical protein
VRRALALLAAVAASAGLARADDPARQDDRLRAIGTTGRYAHGADHDGGAIDVWWREPVAGGLWAEGAIGVLVGTLHGRTTSTLANPVVALGTRLSARSTVRLALTLPAASTRGDAGALAAALAADQPTDPSRAAPGASTIAAGFAQTRRRSLGFVRVDVYAAWTFRPGGPSLPLLHADLSGAVAIARGLQLTAGFRSTAYLLATSPDEDFVHVLALGATLDAGPTTTSIALEAPIDGAARTAGILMATATIAIRP